MAETVVVSRARYVASAVKKEQYPAPLAEIPFVGRSNVGKSSLINSLSRVHGLAHVSKKPGKTQTINFYEMELKSGEDRQKFHLVDLPGYGYAGVGRDKRNVWAKFIGEYLTGSPHIKFVAQLMDIRHELLPIDEEMFRRLTDYELPVLIVATKADKVSRSARSAFVAHIGKRLGVPASSVLPYSSKNNEGRSDLLDTIHGTLL